MTTPDIHCINILLDSPNGNVQLVYNDFLKANHDYDRLMKALESDTSIDVVVQVADSYGQKGVLRVATINTVLMNDTASSMRGGAEIAIMRAVTDTQMNNRAQQHPALKAASMMRGFNGMGPANG